MDRDPIAWLSDITLEGASESVRVTLGERQGQRVLVRQVDPGEPEPDRVPLYESDDLVVMVAISHVGFHSTAEVGALWDLAHSVRVVPVRREGDVVFARSLRHGEHDDGRRVHVPPGGQLSFEEGSLRAELEAIDGAEEATESGYVPLAAV